MRLSLITERYNFGICKKGNVSLVYRAKWAGRESDPVSVSHFHQVHFYMSVVSLCTRTKCSSRMASKLPVS